MRDRGLVGPLLLLLVGLFALQHVPFAGLSPQDHPLHWPQALAGRPAFAALYGALEALAGRRAAPLHLAIALLNLLNAWLAYLLALRLRWPRGWALAAAGLFLVLPAYGDVHYRTAAAAVQLSALAWVLLAFLVAGETTLRPSGRLLAAGALWGAAALSDAQAALLWAPLLYYAGRLGPEPRPSRLQLAAAICAGAAFAAWRLASAGAPAATSAAPPAPSWDALRSVLGGPWPTLAATLALSALWLRAVVRESADRQARPETGPQLVLGALWVAAACAPLSAGGLEPRHLYLPALGALLALTPAAFAAPRRLRPAAAALAFALFAASVAGTLAQGFAWGEAAKLRLRFRQWAVALLGRRAENVFLVGAPRTLHGAPAFDWPGDPVYLFQSETGHLPAEGDVAVTPARSGVFFANRSGAESLRFMPYKRLNMLVYALGEFSCARRLEVRPPGGEPVALRLPGGTRCRSSPQLSAPLWLTAARPASGSGAGVRAENGAELVSAGLAEASGWGELELLWRAAAPIRAEFAAVVRLLDERGRVVFEPVYSIEFFGRREHPTVWPAYNDVHPSTRWKINNGAREVYRLRLDRPLPPGPLTARLTLFERTEGPWRRLGELAVPVARR